MHFRINASFRDAYRILSAKNAMPLNDSQRCRFCKILVPIKWQGCIAKGFSARFCETENPGKEIIDALKGVTELDWFRCSGLGFDAGISNAVIVVWRFRAETSAAEVDRIIEAFRAVLDNFSGNMSWVLSCSGRNSVLSPTNFRESEVLKNFKTAGGEVLASLQERDPGLGEKAQEDLVAIATTLAHSFGL